MTPSDHYQLTAARAIYRLTLRFQQKNRFVGVSAAHSTSPLEMHALVELSGAEPFSAADLGRLLAMRQPTVSKMLAALKQRQLVSRKPHPSDARSSLLTLSTRGRTLLAALDAEANAKYSQFAEFLSSEELLQLASFYQQISDALAAPPSCSRPDEFLARSGIRRLTRALQMLGGNYYDSGLSALEWHVLYLLACAHKSQSIGQISQQLGIAPSAASVAVSSLVKRRFAQRSQDPQDARARRVVLTAAGTQMQEKIEQLAVQRLATAISSIRREHLTTGLSVLERFVGARAVGAGVPLGAYWHMQVLDDEAARRTARALSARHYLGHNIAAALPSSFFSAEDQNYALYSRDKVVGALSLSRLTEGAADGIPVRLNCLTAPQVKVPPGILAEFLCRALLAIQAGAASSNSAAEKSDPVTLLVPPELRRLAPFQGNCSADGQRWRVHARREYEIRDSR